MEDHAHFEIQCVYCSDVCSVLYKTALGAFVLYLMGSCIRFVRFSVYVTKQFFRFHFVVLFISVLAENIRFVCASWASSSVISLPHDTCAGRHMIKFITR